MTSRIRPVPPTFDAASNIAASVPATCVSPPLSRWEIRCTDVWLSASTTVFTQDSPCVQNPNTLWNIALSKPALPNVSSRSASAKPHHCLGRSAAVVRCSASQSAVGSVNSRSRK